MSTPVSPADPVPYVMAVPDEVLTSIRRRVTEYPWDSVPAAGGWRCGTEKAFLRTVADYWRDHYDWREQERRLNRWPQYTVNIDGVSLRFYHVRGANPGRALLLSHGWPGSAFEFLNLMEPLVHPERFGGVAADSFDIVVPCLPGFGFSGPPPAPIGPRAIARLFNRLMTEVLGYRHYIAQGGDWGGAISGWLGHDHAPACRGVHLNMVLVRAAGAPQGDEEVAWVEQARRSRFAEGGYSHQQGSRPQTLAFAMHDSPVGVAAWILEKFAAWSDLPLDQQGVPDLLARYSLDDLITNIMFYVATGSFASAAWIYYAFFTEERSGSFPAGSRCEVPTAVACFPDPTFPPPPKSFVERGYNLAQWHIMPRGGHFAAMEAAPLLVEDIRTFGRCLDRIV